MESSLLRRAVAASAGTRIRGYSEDYDVDTEAVIGQAGSSKDRMEMCTGVSHPTEVLRKESATDSHHTALCRIHMCHLKNLGAMLGIGSFD